MSQNIYPMGGQYEEYLTDESKYSGYADSISFPETSGEAAEILKELSDRKVPITIQGAKTGIVGAAIPKGGHILNLSHMNQVLDSWMEEDGTGRISVQPGINLIDLRKEINNLFRKNPQFWPVDPTETSASDGGIAASGAQGISRILYGKSEQYIESVSIMNYRGQTIKLRRGENRELSDTEQADALELVLGKEGTTGIITELTLKLVPKPEAVWGIAFFFEEDADAAKFVDDLKTGMPESGSAAIAAVEYIDRISLDMIESRKATMTKIKELPDIRPEVAAMIYTEIHGAEEGIEEIAEHLMETAMERGSDSEEAWAVSEEAEVEKLHVFRHAAAETVNLFIEEQHREDGRITKLGMDMLSEGTFADVLEAFAEELAAAGLKGCIFGHAMENHLHVNILPETYEEYCRGVELVRRWALRIKNEQGALIGEHGVGKLKREMLGDLLPEEYIEKCKKAKELFDAENMLNRGNILEAFY